MGRRLTLLSLIKVRAQALSQTESVHGGALRPADEFSISPPQLTRRECWTGIGLRRRWGPCCIAWRAIVSGRHAFPSIADHLLHAMSMAAPSCVACPRITHDLY